MTADEIATALRVMTAIRGLRPDEVATLIRAAELIDQWATR